MILFRVLIVWVLVSPKSAIVSAAIVAGFIGFDASIGEASWPDRNSMSDFGPTATPDRMRPGGVVGIFDDLRRRGGGEAGNRAAASQHGRQRCMAVPLA